MVKTLNEMLRGVSKERKARIESRAKEIIAEEATLRSLREALNKTQESIAEALEINQAQISRIEKRSDILISTLRRFVEAMGGELYLIAQFPEKDPIAIKGFSDIEVGDVPPPHVIEKVQR